MTMDSHDIVRIKPRDFWGEGLAFSSNLKLDAMGNLST